MPPRPKKPTAEKVAAGGQARSLLRDGINAELTPERVKGLIDAAFGAQMTALVTCSECGHTMKAPVPDVKKAVDSLTALIQEAEGRPEQRQPEAVKITIVRPPL